MASVRLHRRSEFGSMFRAFGVYVDGEHVGAIRAGEVRTIDLSPGAHDMEVRLDWGRSPSLHVDDSGPSQLVCGSRYEPSETLWKMVGSHDDLLYLDPTDEDLSVIDVAPDLGGDSRRRRVVLSVLFVVIAAALSALVHPAFPMLVLGIAVFVWPLRELMRNSQRRATNSRTIHEAD